MRFVANTITEYYEHIGELRGEQRGMKIGELKAVIAYGQEQLGQYETLLSERVLSKRAYDRLVKYQKTNVAAAQAELQALDTEPHLQSA